MTGEIIQHTKVYSGGNYISWCRQAQAWEVGSDYDPQIGGGNVAGFMRPVLIDPGAMIDGEVALEVYRGPWVVKQKMGVFDDWKSATSALWSQS